MRFVGLGYRAHDPGWAFDPISGLGAALNGGRFNEPGVPTLYLALTVEGMFLEVGHGFGRRFDPLTVCSYDLDVEDVVDLRTDDARRDAGIALGDLAAPWAEDRLHGRTPRSWIVAARLRSGGRSGIVVPSFAVGAQPDMANLVLWRWGTDPPHRVSVYDPLARLPRDRSSW